MSGVNPFGTFRFPRNHVGTNGLYDVPSFVLEGLPWSSHDRYGNGRDNIIGLKSNGGGNGGQMTTSRPYTNPCPGGPTGDIQTDGRIVSGAVEAWYCIKPTPAGCPVIAGDRAVSVHYLDQSPERLATDNAVVCAYNPETLAKDGAFDDWERSFLGSSEFEASNRAALNEYILPHHCAGGSSNCPEDEISGVVSTRCSRFTSTDNPECRRWMDDMFKAGTPGLVNVAMEQWCHDNPLAADCKCINRANDPIYQQIIATPEFLPDQAGCWYQPCRYGTQLVPFEDICTLTELTQCVTYVANYGNNGVIYNELGQTIACGGPIPDGPPPRGPIIEALSSWPWWAWLIFAVVILLIIVGVVLLIVNASKKPVPAADEVVVSSDASGMTYEYQA